MLCIKCQIEKPQEEFNFKNKTKSIRSNTCRDCHKLYVREHYLQHKTQYQSRAKENTPEYNQRNREYVKEFLLEHPCPCGESDIDCLDFHHLRDKDLTIARLLVRGVSLERIKKEISKCVVLCSNCHRKLHAKERRATRPIR